MGRTEIEQAATFITALDKSAIAKLAHFPTCFSKEFVQLTLSFFLARITPQLASHP